MEKLQQGGPSMAASSLPDLAWRRIRSRVTGAVRSSAGSAFTSHCRTATPHFESARATFPDPEKKSAT
eukprot:10245743-Lingulodinium_polyedra.AAC.2